MWKSFTAAGWRCIVNLETGIIKAFSDLYGPIEYNAFSSTDGHDDETCAILDGAMLELVHALC